MSAFVWSTRGSVSMLVWKKQRTHLTTAGGEQSCSPSLRGPRRTREGAAKWTNQRYTQDETSFMRAVQEFWIDPSFSVDWKSKTFLGVYFKVVSVTVCMRVCVWVRVCFEGLLILFGCCFPSFFLISCNLTPLTWDVKKWGITQDFCTALHISECDIGAKTHIQHHSTYFKIT